MNAFVVSTRDEKRLNSSPSLRAKALPSTAPLERGRGARSINQVILYLNSFVNRILIKKAHAKQRSLPSLTSDITISDKEKEVLQFICMEFTAQEIAQKMQISPRTVEAIKDRLMERFGSKNTAGLVFFAVKNNLVD